MKCFRCNSWPCVCANATLPLGDCLEVMQQLPPIAQLGATEMQFGLHAGRTFDDVPLSYLEWLCRSHEEFYKNLRAYLKHPDLESRRRGLGD